MDEIKLIVGFTFIHTNNSVLPSNNFKTLCQCF